MALKENAFAIIEHSSGRVFDRVDALYRMEDCMNLPEIRPEHAPKFMPGDKVWIIAGKKRVHRHRVSAVQLTMARIDGKTIVACEGYKLDTFNIQALDRMTPPTFFYPWEVYRLRREAAADAAWHPVKGISNEEWLKAVGNREDDASLDDCELFRCCAAVSDSRDILIRCSEDGGLIERDLSILKQLTQQCGHAEPGERAPILQRIYSQLGI